MSGENSCKRSIVFFLIPDFTMMAFSAALEPLRAANRMAGYEAYTWRLASCDGEPVRASNGVEVAVGSSLAAERQKMVGHERPSMVIVCGGLNIEDYSNKTVFAWLREEYNRGVAIGGLCTAAYVLAGAGLLADRRCAIHWENLPGFAERYPRANVFADLFETEANIYTCAGGTAAMDMMLKLIGEDFDDSLINRVCGAVIDGPGAQPLRPPAPAAEGAAWRAEFQGSHHHRAYGSQPGRAAFHWCRSRKMWGSPAVRSSACSDRRWGVRPPATIWKSALTGPATS